MKYTKPEVFVLGDAKVAIEELSKGSTQVPDNIQDPFVGPAYDLDE